MIEDPTFCQQCLHQYEQWVDHAVSSSAMFSIINSPQFGTQGFYGAGGITSQVRPSKEEVKATPNNASNFQLWIRHCYRSWNKSFPCVGRSLRVWHLLERGVIGRLKDSMTSPGFPCYRHSCGRHHIHLHWPSHPDNSFCYQSHYLRDSPKCSKTASLRHKGTSPPVESRFIFISEKADGVVSKSWTMFPMRHPKTSSALFWDSNETTLYTDLVISSGPGLSFPATLP